MNAKYLRSEKVWRTGESKCETGFKRCPTNLFIIFLLRTFNARKLCQAFREIFTLRKRIYDTIARGVFVQTSIFPDFHPINRTFNQFS